MYLTTYRVSTSRPWNIKIRFAIDTQRTEGQLATRNPHRQVTDSNATLACVTTGRTKTSPYLSTPYLEKHDPHPSLEWLSATHTDRFR